MGSGVSGLAPILGRSLGKYLYSCLRPSMIHTYIILHILVNAEAKSVSWVSMDHHWSTLSVESIGIIDSLLLGAIPSVVY